MSAQLEAWQSAIPEKKKKRPSLQSQTCRLQNGEKFLLLTSHTARGSLSYQPELAKTFFYKVMHVFDTQEKWMWPFPIYKSVSPLLLTPRFLGSPALCSVPVGTPSWMSEHIAKIQIPVGKMNFIPIVAALTTSQRIIWKHGKAAMGRMLHSALSPFLKITEGKEAP